MHIQFMVYIKTNWSHFILGGLNYYELTYNNKYIVLIVVILYFKTLLLLLRWDMVKGLLHPKFFIFSSFTYPHVVPTP